MNTVGTDKSTAVLGELATNQSSLSRKITPPPAVAVATLPERLQGFVKRLEEFALANLNDAKKDSRAFWALKSPTIFSAVLASATALAGLAPAAAVFGIIAAVAGAVEALNPRAPLRNAHLRGVHELRLLEHNILNEWNVAELEGAADQKTQAELLKKGMVRLDEIAKRISDAETVLGGGQGLAVDKPS
jgi:hypothetical protein